jgi:hypothetical protein
MVFALESLGDACPSADAARPKLAEQTTVRIDGMPCTLEQILSVSEPEPSEVTSCCYTVACDPPPTALEATTLFEAACVGLRCADVDLSAFTLSRAQEKTKPPQCKLDPSATAPAERKGLRCQYNVSASYSCSNAPW